MIVRRVLSEKKPDYAVEAKGILHDVTSDLDITTLTNVRVINRYDVSGITDEEYAQAKNVVFSEPPVDNVYDETVDLGDSCRSRQRDHLHVETEQKRNRDPEWIHPH